MIKRCFFVACYCLFFLFFPLFGNVSATNISLLRTNSFGEGADVYQSFEQNVEIANIYITSQDLLIELKENVKQVIIYDITGREILVYGATSVGQYRISKDRLPSSPSIILIRIIDQENNAKTFKVRI